MKLKSIHYFIIFVIVALCLLIGARLWSDSQPGQYDEFAQCVADSGAIFYGAFWCPHCENQKKDFGNSVKYLPYLECSTPDGQNQTQECIDAEIKTYPTWDWPDGSRDTGKLSMSKISEETGCQLPN